MCENPIYNKKVLIHNAVIETWKSIYNICLLYFLASRIRILVDFIYRFYLDIFHSRSFLHLVLHLLRTLSAHLHL